MTTTSLQSRMPSREQLQQWGVLALMALLLISIVLFVFLVLLPDLKRRVEYKDILTSAESDLHAAQVAQAEAPGQMQAKLTETQSRLNETAQSFLNETESTVAVNKLYSYAEEVGVEIVNLQAAPAIVTDTHSQRDYLFQVAGQPRTLLSFLGRIEEVGLRGFVVNQVALAPNPDAPAGKAQHLLTMNVSVVTSPFATRLASEPAQNSDNFANVGDLPLAEVQRQVDLAWGERNWGEAIDLLEQVVATAPENEPAQTTLYRAHMNYGYQYLVERNEAAAKAEFEAALAVLPTGSEASAELQQLASDSTLSHRVEDELRQQLEQAKATGNWQEVIRLLRIIAAVDPEYGPVGDALTQAYMNYGNQLALAGDSARAEEQYQLAQYSTTNQAPLAGVSVAAAITDSLTSPAANSAQTPVSTSASIEISPTLSPPIPVPPTSVPPTPMPQSTETPTLIPTLSPTSPPTASPIPSATPLPTATQTPVPTSTPTATQLPPATATSTATSVQFATATPLATGSIPMPTQAQPAITNYVVQAGDTLFSIARRFGTTVESLRAINGLPNDMIRMGQVLVIGTSSPQLPSSGYVEYTVTPNDTLFSLAQRYGTTVEAIMQINGLNDNRIYVGQRLRMPVAAVAIVPTPIPFTPTPIPFSPTATAVNVTPTNTPLPTVTSTPPATATSISTATFVPTATSSSTTTTTPTSTPLSTATPQITADDILFVERVVNIFDVYSDATNHLSGQLLAASVNPEIMATEDWVVSTAFAIAAIREFNEQIRGLTVPPRYEASGNEMRIAADLSDQALDALLLGIDNKDVAQLNLFSQLMTETIAAINRAKAALPT